jgi:hypothetical protein
METSQILAEIDSEIERLEQVKALLTDNSSPRSGRPTPSVTAPKKRHMSAAARAKIAAAQKARWARVRKADK